MAAAWRRGGRTPRFGVLPRHVNVCGLFALQAPAPRRPQSLNRWPRPNSPASASSTIMYRMLVARPAQYPAPHGVGMDAETPVQLRPRQPRLLLEPLQPLGEVVGDFVGLSGVVYALSRHWSFRRTAAISLQLRCPGRTGGGAQASAVSPVPEPWGRPPIACPRAVADSPSPSMCAGFFRCPLPAPTADGRRQLVGQLSAVARADGSLAFAVLAIRYGASGMSMWNQRDRSLVPCSLMALMR